MCFRSAAVLGLSLALSQLLVLHPVSVSAPLQKPVYQQFAESFQEMA